MMTTIHFNLEINKTPRAVWNAIARADALRDWLMPNDFRAEVGAKFSFWRTDGSQIVCRVIEVRPGELLAYWWDDGSSGSPSLVVWTLDPTSTGTRLVMEHRLIEAHPVTALEASANWEAARGRITPVVFMTAEEESDPNRRLAGLRNRNAAELV